MSLKLPQIPATHPVGGNGLHCGYAQGPSGDLWKSFDTLLKQQPHRQGRYITVKGHLELEDATTPYLVYVRRGNREADTAANMGRTKFELQRNSA